MALNKAGLASDILDLMTQMRWQMLLTSLLRQVKFPQV